MLWEEEQAWSQGRSAKGAAGALAGEEGAAPLDPAISASAYKLQGSIPVTETAWDTDTELQPLLTGIEVGGPGGAWVGSGGLGNRRGFQAGGSC